MPKSSERSGLLQVRLRPNLYASVHLLAAEKELTAAELVRRLIDDELEKHPRIRATVKAAGKATPDTSASGGAEAGQEIVRPKKKMGRPRKPPSVAEIEAAMQALEERAAHEEPVEGEFVPQ